MAVDFQKLLSKQATEIEKPKPLPVGSYICNVPQIPQFKALGKDETPFAVFQLIVLSASDDVDTDDLSDFGEIVGKRVIYNMAVSEQAQFRAKETLANAFGIEEEGKTLGQMFNEVVNRQVLVKISHRPNQDGTEMYTQVDSLAAV